MSYFLTQSSLGLPNSASTSQQSTPVDCQNMGKVSFQVTATAPGTSTAQLQVSNDGANWVSLGTPTSLVAGSIMVEKVDLTQRYCRLNLVVTSGTVTGLTAVFNGKL